MSMTGTFFFYILEFVIFHVSVCFLIKEVPWVFPPPPLASRDGLERLFLYSQTWRTTHKGCVGGESRSEEKRQLGCSRLQASVRSSKSPLKLCILSYPKLNNWDWSMVVLGKKDFELWKRMCLSKFTRELHTPFLCCMTEIP